MGATASSVFTTLDATGQFHRDTAIGRLFHPGAESFREVGDGERLHVAVLPDNRISVHIDRVSPLCARPDRRFRYSVLRAAAHTVVYVLELISQWLGGRGHQHRCELHCEMVWVDDEEPVDGGVTGSGARHTSGQG